MANHNKWLNRFAIVMVVLTLSSLYSNWRVIRAVQQPTTPACVAEAIHAAE